MNETSVLPPDSRRWAARLAIHTDVLVIHGERAWKLVLEDVSETGCSLVRTSHSDLKVNDFVRIYPYPLDEAPVMPITGRIARVGERRYGVAFQTEADTNRF